MWLLDLKTSALWLAIIGCNVGGRCKVYDSLWLLPGEKDLGFRSQAKGLYRPGALLGSTMKVPLQPSPTQAKRCM